MASEGSRPDRANNWLILEDEELWDVELDLPKRIVGAIRIFWAMNAAMLSDNAVDAVDPVFLKLLKFLCMKFGSMVREIVRNVPHTIWEVNEENVMAAITKVQAIPRGKDRVMELAEEYLGAGNRKDGVILFNEQVLYGIDQELDESGNVKDSTGKIYETPSGPARIWVELLKAKMVKSIEHVDPPYKLPDSSSEDEIPAIKNERSSS